MCFSQGLYTLFYFSLNEVEMSRFFSLAKDLLNRLMEEASPNTGESIHFCLVKKSLFIYNSCTCL